MSNYKGPYDLTDKADADALGTAATSDVTTSATDTTAGRLLKVGDFGVGGRHSGTLNNLFNSDFNSFVDFSGTGTTSSTWSNGPLGDGVVHSGILCQQVRSFNNLTVQTWMSTNGLIVSRHGRPSTEDWSPWVENYHTGNILGTVSQSGGVPAGAIIERGSNANGEFVKFADGTMICTMSDTREIDTNADAVLGGGRFLSLELSFPADFAAAPTMSAQSSDSATWVNPRLETTTTCRYVVYSNIGSDRGSITIKVTAIGRWY